MKKNIFLLSALVLLALCSCGNNNRKEDIHLNGKVENTIEVNTVYRESGITCPDKYTVVIDGYVISTKLGRYDMTYSVYSEDGELLKELHRFVNVVDTTAPVFTPNNSISEYKVGKYQLTDFISSYSDNYDEVVQVSQETFNLIPGVNQIAITFTDSSGNSSTFEKSVTASLDMEKVIRDAYESQPYKVTSDSTGIGSNYVRVQIDSDTSIAYYDSGTLHYLKTVSTELGTRASIQISAEYGKFNNASVDYHISGSGSTYSVGFATIDATNKNASVSGFTSTINNLNLDTNEMLEELNTSLPNVIEAFQLYISGTLNLELK